MKNIFLTKMVFISLFCFCGELTMANEADLKVKMPGKYLVVWNAVHSYIVKSGSKLDYEDYTIVIDELEEEYIVKFSKKFEEPILGGGVGHCRVSKSDLSIIEFKLIR